MSWILNNILNQKGSPAIYTDTLANRPAAGYTGRLFVASDTFAWYRDNGTGWDLIGGPGSGTITGTLTANRVAYATGSNTIATSANFLFDGTNAVLLNDASIGGISIGKGGGSVSDNTRVGASALSVNTTGSENTAFGYFAMAANNTGSASIAIGFNALVSAQNASQHIAIGARAMEFLNNNNTGSVAVGTQALRYITTGGGNNAFGNFAGILTTSGSYNQYFGRGAGYNVTTGSYNEIIGHDAGYRITTGNYNICIGYRSGGNSILTGVATGDENIFIGANTLPSSTSASNQIVIGYGAAATAANTVVIGNNNIVNTYLKGAINFSTGVITKTASGIALNITDSANGNALNIDKTGSGFAINVAAGTSNFQNIIAVKSLFQPLIANDYFLTAYQSNSGVDGWNLQVDNNGNFNFIKLIAGVIQPIAFSITQNNTITSNAQSWTIGPVISVGTGDLYLKRAFTTAQVFGTNASPVIEEIFAYSYNTLSKFAIEAINSFSNNNATGFQFKIKNNIDVDIIPLTFEIGVGNATFVSSIKTGNPTSGTAAAWKLGSYVAVAAPAPTGYIEIDINGTLYKIAAGT